MEGTLPESRADPLYWILMLPMVWWASDLTQFSARFFRVWTPAMVLSSTGAIVGLAFGAAKGEDALLPLLDAGVCVCAASASLILRRGSLVDREGPAR